MRDVALVTGASGALGAAIAVRLARDGYAICAHYHRNVAAVEEVVHSIEREEGHATAVQADLLKLADIRQLVAAALGMGGRLAILVNNAAVSRDRPLGLGDDQGFCSVIELNSLAAIRCTNEVVRPMARCGGSIVNVGSLSHVQPRMGQSAYATSKAGLVGLTRAAALELARFGVRVNLVEPGPIVGSMLVRPEAVAQAAALIPLGTVPTASDVAEIVAWLCTRQAACITGQTLVVDGGLSLTNAMSPF
jgi:3-oxoacyl-[acyl-carrier protein] reductase